MDFPNKPKCLFLAHCYSILLWTSVNYGHKKFYSTCPWCQFHKTFLGHNIYAPSDITWAKTWGNMAIAAYNMPKKVFMKLASDQVIFSLPYDA